jgi:broad specificity phosphatase PhoE
MTRVYLLRHADVENPRRVLYGHLPGFPLSERGRGQAVAVGRYLRDRVIRRIVHSPLSRAVETARLVQEQLGPEAPLIADDRLREAEFSRYLQGVPFWQIPVRRPLWVVHKARRGLLPGDEALDRLGGRVLEVASQMVADHPDEASLLVSHADPLQAAWVLLDGRPRTERELYRKQVARAGLLEVEMDGDRVLAVNYVAPAEQPERAGLDGSRPVPPSTSQAG